MKMALKIWRYDPVKGERALKEYEVDAPDWATLLDVLDIVKDRYDGTLAYRKSCRMMICGSCGMRMDGAAVLACKTRMVDIAESGHVPVISAMGNMPIVKDLVVDMEPFWGKIRAVQPFLEPGYTDPGEKEYVVSQEQMDMIHKESLCIMCGCCVSECNSMEADPDFLGPAALAKGMRFVGDARDRATVERLQEYSASTASGTARAATSARALPEGRRPARRDRQARRRGHEGRHRLRHGREAREVVRHLREDDRLAARDGARAEDAGHGKSLKEMKFAMGLAKHGKVPPPSSARREARRRGAGAVRPREAAGPRRRAGVVQGRRRSRTSSSPRATRKPRSVRRGLVPATRSASGRRTAPA